MLTHIRRFPLRPAVDAPCRPSLQRNIRTAVVVCRSPQQDVYETALRAADHDVVFVESIALAYSQIKRVMPDVVIVCLSSDDAEACQFLSMLALDRAVSRIPVVTLLTTATDVCGSDPVGCSRSSPFLN